MEDLPIKLRIVRTKCATACRGIQELRIKSGFHVITIVAKYVVQSLSSTNAFIGKLDR
jgi:hypothetical protein